MEQIKLAGKRLRRVVLALLVLTPLIYTVSQIMQGPTPLLALPAHVTLDLSNTGIATLLLLAVLPALTPFTYWLGFIFLYRLCGRYALGEVFTSQAIRLLFMIGIILSLTDIVYMLQVAITGPLLTWLGLTPGFVTIELRLGTTIAGLFIILISRIMLLAADLEEQQRLTI